VDTKDPTRRIHKKTSRGGKKKENFVRAALTKHEKRMVIKKKGLGREVVKKAGMQR